MGQHDDSDTSARPHGRPHPMAWPGLWPGRSAHDPVRLASSGVDSMRTRRAALTLASVAAIVTVSMAGQPSAELAATALPACTTEDSVTACRWEASERGNGRGRSFTVDEHGAVTYDEPTAS